MGVDAWPVDTVHFSNNTDYDTYRGPVMTSSQVGKIIRGIDELGVLGSVQAVLSGYQGAADMGRTIVQAVELVRERNPEAIYCCDPVMGDTGPGFYAAPGIPEFMRDHVVPHATVMTPNLFELEYLTSRTCSTLSQVLQAAADLRTRGPRTVLVTSVTGLDDASPGMRMIAQDSSATWQVVTPMIDQRFTGSGDLTAAVFLANLLSGEPLDIALSRTASAVYSVVHCTHALGRRELAVVQAQNDIAAPRHMFEATAI